MSIKGLAWYTSSGTYSISPFTFKLMILNLTLLLWSTGFSLFSGGSTNLKTVNPSKKIRRGTQQNIKWSRGGGGECAAKEEKIKKTELPVATILSPGASIPPGGRI